MRSSRSRAALALSALALALIGVALDRQPAAAAPATVTGTVRNESGAPVSDAAIYVYEHLGGSPLESAITGPDGTFELILDTGSYDINVSHSDYHRQTIGDALGFSDNAPALKIADDQVIDFAVTLVSQAVPVINIEQLAAEWDVVDDSLYFIYEFSSRYRSGLNAAEFRFQLTDSRGQDYYQKAVSLEKNHQGWTGPSGGDPAEYCGLVKRDHTKFRPGRLQLRAWPLGHPERAVLATVDAQDKVCHTPTIEIWRTPRIVRPGGRARLSIDMWSWRKNYAVAGSVEVIVRGDRVAVRQLNRNAGTRVRLHRFLEVGHNRVVVRFYPADPSKLDEVTKWFVWKKTRR